MSAGRLCACGCTQPLPPGSTARRRFLSTTHRTRAWKEDNRLRRLPWAADAFRVDGGAAFPTSTERDRSPAGGCVPAAGATEPGVPPGLGTQPFPSKLQRPALFGLADPPYPGRAHLYSGRPHAAEVDHRILVGSLCLHYPDGWALFTASDTLQQVMSVCPPGARTLAWHRKTVEQRPVSVPRTWEPIVLYGGRKLASGVRLPDWLSANPSGRADCPGAKPLEVGVFVLAHLGARSGDSVADLFPGSGNLSRSAVRLGLSVPLARGTDQSDRAPGRHVQGSFLEPGKRNVPPAPRRRSAGRRNAP